ncbi:putative glutathione S-transferase [Kushneria sinocarnis]|uniref:Putative glutathione S-transferase n=1 Tax=Kushneria sinocarnis TaxID=595502 RepID=A0A420WUA2_9GAMM|nr:glutathione S-transferase family protein [Kushneria sinocarnis]RKQ97029.1 putative glutathione S-transferase [Kushneria sinocarnis]
MGLLIDGEWFDRNYDTKSHGGEFVRESAQLREWITRGGEPGPGGEPGIPAETGRFHLYVSLACPWAHRALIMRRLKGLEELIGVSVTSPYMLDEGWTYRLEEGSSGDPINGVQRHYQLYTLTDPHYTGRTTVPALWDCKQNRIVNNESAELVRIFNTAFDHLTDNRLDLYPESLRAEIDRINARVYDDINNGVYKTGFATEQSVYEQHFATLFDALDWLEALLGERRYLAGEYLTEADIRLFTTLVRFDAVYHGHFKCNLRRIEDYPHLAGYLRELYQWPGVRETVNFTHIKRHYYGSHRAINPTGIVPRGPALDLDRPHGREWLQGAGVMRHA